MYTPVNPGSSLHVLVFVMSGDNEGFRYVSIAATIKALAYTLMPFAMTSFLGGGGGEGFCHKCSVSTKLLKRSSGIFGVRYIFEH